MKIIECPRDAMQGIESWIPTEIKIKYINQLLKVGFDTIDFGSFVSPKAIPQMKDSQAVLEGLDLSGTSTKLLAIIANIRGAETAIDFEEVSYLGYPLSISETFQQRNTNRSIHQALGDLAEIQDLCQEADRTLVVYLSMGFGNPYQDPYSTDLVGEFVQQLDKLEVEIISLSDTIGVADKQLISDLFETIIPKFPHIEFGAHLHTLPETAAEKVTAAYESGCRRIDGALKGFGGCPMAKDELTGNMPTEVIIDTLENLGVSFPVDHEALNRSLVVINDVFN